MCLQLKTEIFFSVVSWVYCTKKSSQDFSSNVSLKLD